MQVTKTKEIPGPKGKPIVGVALEFRKDPLNYMEMLRETYGHIVKAKLGPLEGIFLFDPEYVKYCLATNNSNYHKSKTYQGLKEILNEGLLTNEDETWRKHRKIIQPVFNTSQILDYVAQFNDITSKYIAKWSEMGEMNDLNEMVDLTSSIVTKTILGSDMDLEPELISEAISYITLHLQKTSNGVLVVPQFIPTPDNRKYAKSLNIINSVVNELFDKAKNSDKQGKDILSRLMVATDVEFDKPLSDSEIKDEIRTFFMAGHETTAITLTWTLYLLSKHPAVRDKMIEEIHAVLGKDKDPKPEDLKKLVYVEHVINESLRLYPPAYIFARTPIKEDVIDGYRIPLNSTIATVPYILHRDPTLWEDPLNFKPERFEKDPVHPYAYVPFGGGPRMCIGKNFALIELKIVLSKIFQNHYVEMKTDKEIMPTAQFTLRPGEPIFLLFKRQQ